MAGPCDGLLGTLMKAERANDLAEKSLASAEAALSSAEWNYAAALAAEIACVLTVETGPGFLACEAAALAWAEGSAAAMDSAQLAIDVAQAQVDDTQEDEDQARDDFCDCINANPGTR